MDWPSITVVTPTIRPRIEQGLAGRAKASVLAQMYQGDVIHLVIEDEDRQGAARTRQRGLEAVETPWVAFLDDDDAFHADHLETLMTAALENDADYVYSWFDCVGGYDPFPMHFGQKFDPLNPVQTTVTTLVKTELAQQAGFVSPAEKETPDGNIAGEDWSFTLRCIELGATILHVPKKTWDWHHWGGNTSGLPDRW